LSARSVARDVDRDQRKLRNSHGGARVSDLCRFTVIPPLRCCARVPHDVNPVCGRPAHWQTRPAPGSLPSYLCAVHRAPDDPLIARVVIVRRIALPAVVYFAGAGWNAGVMRADAAARLEQAVRDAGGLLDLMDATDVLGRFEGPGGETRGRPRKNGVTV